MMKQITIFGDIHANLPALEAVFTDMTARQLDNLYCLGDLVGYGVWPNEVIDAIRQRDIPTIMGNYDQGVGKTATTAAAPTARRKRRRWACAPLPGQTPTPRPRTRPICAN
jgi:predicted phosphodiesterase